MNESARKDNFIQRICFFSMLELCLYIQLIIYFLQNVHIYLQHQLKILEWSGKNIKIFINWFKISGIEKKVRKYILVKSILVFINNLCYICFAFLIYIVIFLINKSL